MADANHIKNRKSFEERFWEKVDTSAGPKGCWLWLAYKNRKGYGTIGRGGRCGGMIRSHVASWNIRYGYVPKGLCVLHKCDNPPCVNPDHLFLGTHEVNVADQVRKGRHCFGERNGRAKLNEDQVRRIRKLYAQGVSPTEISSEINVPRETISSIVNLRSWKHVGEL